MTLIEILMAFAILVVGLVSIFAVLFTGTRSHSRAIRETESSMVAMSIIDDLRAEFALGRKAPATFSTKGEFQESTDFPGYKYRIQVIPLKVAKQGEDRLLCNEYFVRVSVKWRQRGDDESLDYDTVIFIPDKPVTQ